MQFITSILQKETKENTGQEHGEKKEEMQSQKTQNKMVERSQSVSKQILQLKDRKAQIVFEDIPNHIRFMRDIPKIMVQNNTKRYERAVNCKVLSKWKTLANLSQITHQLIP